jgi:hypothetical protein
MMMEYTSYPSLRRNWLHTAEFLFTKYKVKEMTTEEAPSEAECSAP